MPVAGSSSRNVAQPLVRQNGRPAAFAAEARRRSRRMELARPAYVAAAERDIIWFGISLLSGTAGGSGLGSALVSIRCTTPEIGGGAVQVVRAACRERPLSRRSTGAVAGDRL